MRAILLDRGGMHSSIDVSRIHDLHELEHAAELKGRPNVAAVNPTGPPRSWCVQNARDSEFLPGENSRHSIFEIVGFSPVMLKGDSPNAPVDSAQNFTVGVGRSVVLKPQSPAMTAAACVGGLLVPGLGHLLLGRWIRGILLLASVS